MKNSPEILLVGHPFAPIGMGEHIRSSFRAFQRIGMKPGVLDIYDNPKIDKDSVAELLPLLTRDLAPINVFHINGDEVEGSLEHLSSLDFSTTYQIIYPAWELAQYPAEWAKQLERFHEVWAPSKFIQHSLKNAVSVPVLHMPLGCEVQLSSFRGRRYFGIPETAYTFLFFFDFRSYVFRKNPQAVVDCFRKILAQRPYAPICLIMKFHGAEQAPEEAKRFFDSLSDIRHRMILLDSIMDDNDIKNLIRCSDCFLSLHRSEGFGRGLSEAMYLGKPVIATGYSGNLDFMTKENSFLVDYQLIPVGKEEYPFGEGQVWAEPDLDQAVTYMLRLLDDPHLGWTVGQKAKLSIRRDFGYQKTGLRYLERISHLQGLNVRKEAYVNS